MRLTNEGHYIFEKRGWFYFSRRIPSDIQQHYTKSRIVFALRTRSKQSAVAKATTLAATLEEDWLTLRWRQSSDPSRRFLRLPAAQPTVPETGAPSLTEALDLYIRLKDAGRSKVFRQTAERAVGYFIEMFGDHPVDQYSRQQVNDLRDTLFSRGLASDRILFSLNLVPLTDQPDLIIDHVVWVNLRRRGVETKLVLEGSGGAASNPDSALIKAVVRAHRWFDDLTSGRACTFAKIAEQEGLGQRYDRNLLPLAFLSPEIIEAILNGTQPVNLTTERLTKRVDLPLAWSDQMALLDFD